MDRGREKTSKYPRRSFCGEITADDVNIPLDLTVEILKKLPAKSLVRFQCVSKQWSTIIGSRKDFIDSIVTRSLAQPPRDNLHFIFHHCSIDPFFIFSDTYYPRKYHAVSIPGQCQNGFYKFEYVRGLICCRSSLASHLVMIYNPTTRQSVSLPEIDSPSNISIDCFFGYDPVMNQYKVMCVINGPEHVCQVFTLGDPKKQWRNILGFGIHSPIITSVHINGTIYYEARACIWSENGPTYRYSSETMVLSFDFRSERFDHINAPEEVTNPYRNPTLVNYKGKLGCLCCNNGAELWVMESAEKQEWSNTIFCLPDFTFKGLLCDRFSGITLGGEIFIVEHLYRPYDPLYVYFYDPKQNSFRRTEIQGTTTPHSDPMIIVGVSDHVENTMCL